MNRSSKRRLAVARLQAKNVPMGTTTWRVAKSLLKLLSQVDVLWPQRRRETDGTLGDASHQSRDSDHNPWVKDGSVGVVTAIDITHDPVGGCDAEQVVASLLSSRDPRIKYIIWNRRIVSATVSPWKWRPYKGAKPHTNHFHLSVVSNKSYYDDQGDWDLAPA